MLFGAVIGAGSSGPLSDKIGRRRLVLFIAIIFALGAFILAIAPNVTILVLGRIVIGLAVGVQWQQCQCIYLN